MKYRGRITGAVGLPDLNFDVWAENNEEATSTFKKNIVAMEKMTIWSNTFILFPPEGMKEQDAIAIIDTERPVILKVRDIKVKKPGVQPR